MFGWTILFTFIAFMNNKLHAELDCPIIPAHPSDRRPNKTSIRLVQYNVEWLFIDYNANADCPGSHCSWVNQSEAQKHLQYVSKVVQTLNPDIMNLCEIEGCDELHDIINTTGITDLMPYLIQGADTSTGQNVGMLTKIDPIVSLYRTEERIAFPIPNSLCGYTGEPGTSGVSKHYITEFIFNGLKVAMIGVHLVAYPTDPTRCVQREAQAQVIQNVIRKYVTSGYEIIVLGDFNDFDNETIDANNNRPISQTLDIVKGMAGQFKNVYTLTNLAEKIPQTERYTDWWDKNEDGVSSPTEFSMIDHVLTTATIRDWVDNVFVYHGYSEFSGTYNSDHYPVVIDFHVQ